MRQIRHARVLSAALCAALALGGLAACGEPAGGGDSDSGEKQQVKKLAFFGFATANSFAQATWAGVQDEAKRQGVQAKFFDPNFDADKQVAQMQNAIASGEYQAFVVQANDGNSVVPPIREALNSGIKVVAEFTPVGTRYDTLEPQVPGLIFVGETPTGNGKALGELGVKACGDRDPCNVAYLEGFKTLPLDNARTAEVKKALAAGPNVKVVASVQGGYTQAEGLKAAQNVLQANKDVDVMIGSSQAMAGAQQAVADAGKTGDIELIGNGGSRQAVKNVNSGKWYASYVIAERSSGEKAAELAIKAAKGEKVPKSFDTRDLQNPIGTKANLGDFQGQYDD